jgi:hypothetical protein
MKQQRLLATDPCLPLPSSLALAMLNAAARLREQLTWTTPTRHNIVTFRAIMAVCTKYAFFCRAESGVRCRTRVLTVDRPSRHIWLVIR